jgi:hypothetical protein
LLLFPTGHKADDMTPPAEKSILLIALVQSLNGSAPFPDRRHRPRAITKHPDRSAADRRAQDRKDAGEAGISRGATNVTSDGRLA